MENLTSFSIIPVAIIGLFGIGLYGLLIQRNLIKIVVALQILIKGAMIAMVFAGKANNNVALGGSMAMNVIVADTIVAVVALALATQVRKYAGTLDVKDISKLRR